MLSSVGETLCSPLQLGVFEQNAVGQKSVPANAWQRFVFKNTFVRRGSNNQGDQIGRFFSYWAIVYFG
jgi:hypothetical protein